MATTPTLRRSESQAVLALLGGRKTLGSTPHGDDDYIALVRRGLPFSAFQTATAALTLSLRDIESALQLSVRSLHRRRAGRLTPVESERVMRLVRVAARAEHVLGDRAAALDWLQSPNRALAGDRPIALLDTDLGVQRVVEVLGRIEFGVYG
jgi:putative toxin-antitoxin system antitoxin component (TIGR02293 family)